VTKPTITQQNKFVSAENRYWLNAGHMNEGMKITWQYITRFRIVSDR
jgi:hypothetical protein